MKKKSLPLNILCARYSISQWANSFMTCESNWTKQNYSSFYMGYVNTLNYRLTFLPGTNDLVCLPPGISNQDLIFWTYKEVTTSFNFFGWQPDVSKLGHEFSTSLSQLPKPLLSKNKLRVISIRMQMFVVLTICIWNCFLSPANGRIGSNPSGLIQKQLEMPGCYSALWLLMPWC